MTFTNASCPLPNCHCAFFNPQFSNGTSGQLTERVESPLGGKVERWLKVVDVFFMAVDSCDRATR